MKLKSWHRISYQSLAVPFTSFGCAKQSKNLKRCLLCIVMQEILKGISQQWLVQEIGYYYGAATNVYAIRYGYGVSASLVIV